MKAFALQKHKVAVWWKPLDPCFCMYDKIYNTELVVAGVVSCEFCGIKLGIDTVGINPTHISLYIEELRDYISIHKCSGFWIIMYPETFNIALFMYHLIFEPIIRQQKKYIEKRKKRLETGTKGCIGTYEINWMSYPEYLKNKNN